MKKGKRTTIHWIGNERSEDAALKILGYPIGSARGNIERWLDVPILFANEVRQVIVQSGGVFKKETPCE